MKNFLTTWLIVGIGGLIALFAAMALFGAMGDAFWPLYLLGTAVLAGAINGGMSLSEKLERLEKRLAELEKAADPAASPSEKQ
ncbi:MAG: hypothetical protein RRY97_04025 [Oscillibacter sp.]